MLSRSKGCQRMDTEKKQIGATEEMKEFLKEICGPEPEKIFNEQQDCFKFAVGLALRFNEISTTNQLRTSTTWGVSTIDPERMIGRVVQLVRPEDVKAQGTYQTVERLADWGLRKLRQDYIIGDELDIEKLKDDLDSLPEPSVPMDSDSLS